MYSELEKQEFDPPRDKYLRRCIDGKSANCSVCIGFCQYAGHRGYLTNKLRRKHNCLGKNCFYYIPKEKKQREPKPNDSSDRLLNLAIEIVSQYEGLKVINAKGKGGSWVLKYVTLSNDYPFELLAKRISEEFGQTATFVRLNCDFEEAAKLVFTN